MVPYPRSGPQPKCLGDFSPKVKDFSLEIWKTQQKVLANEAEQILDLSNLIIFVQGDLKKKTTQVGDMYCCCANAQVPNKKGISNRSTTFAEKKK